MSLLHSFYVQLVCYNLHTMLQYLHLPLAPPPKQMLPVRFRPTVFTTPSLTNSLQINLNLNYILTDTINPYFPHFSHFSMNMFPCSSERFSLGRPDLRCSPSTFWLMTYLTTPTFTSSTRAMCVWVGTASSNVTSVSTFAPCLSKVHTPFGPRKSGIPECTCTCI